MKRYLAIILSFCLVTSSFLLGCSSSDEETNFNVDPASEGQKLLNERCTSCHDLNKVYNKKTDRSGWEKIINDMVKKGAKLDSSEKTILIDYLLSR